MYWCKQNVPFFTQLPPFPSLLYLLCLHNIWMVPLQQLVINRCVLTAWQENMTHVVETLIQISEQDMYVGPLHLVWLVSFGCWVLWSMVLHMCFDRFFLAWVVDVEVLFLSLTPEILSILSDWPLTRKNCLLFKLWNFWVIDWPKQFCQSAK